MTDKQKKVLYRIIATALLYAVLLDTPMDAKLSPCRFSHSRSLGPNV